MRKFLSIDNIVDVTSRAVASKDSSIRLNTLILSKFDENNPAPLFQEFANHSEVFAVYGNGALYEFSKTHFGFISKSSTSPNLLSVFTWSKADTSAYLVGGESELIAKLKTLNGQITIEVDGTKSTGTLDLTSAEITDYSQVAEKIATAINADRRRSVVVSCSYSVQKKGFILKTTSAGVTSSISALGGDLAKPLGLDADSARIIAGSKGLADLASVLNEIEAINGDYFVVTPNFKFENELDDLIVFGEWLNASKGRYLGIYSWDNKQLGVRNSGAVDKLLGFSGLYIDWERVPNQNAFSSALISSMDLNKSGGVVNINFNNAAQYLDKAVSIQSEFDGMNSNRANAPYVFGTLGKFEVAYGQGQLMGDIPSANVYINNSFLKFKMQLAISQFFMSSGIVSARGQGGTSAISALLTPIFNDAVKNNLIVIDGMSETEKSVILQNFRDGAKAIENIEASGWSLEVGDVNLARREITLNYAYIANIPANRVIVRTYILGA